MLAHPEWVDGRRLWVDGAMADLIDKLHNGDPTIGWEGDERLAVYFDGDSRRWEVMRLEDDNVYRLVARSAPGVPLDERFLWFLCEHDRNRRKVALHDQIVDHNDRVAAGHRAEAQEFMREEAEPRLYHAIRKEAGW